MNHYDDEINKLTQLTGEYAGISATGNSAYIPPTDRQKLEQKKKILTAELDAVENALLTLDKYPELENFTKILQRALR